MAKRRRRRHQRQHDAAAADEADSLSRLPDELLRRILFFAPAKEGASTCVLCRRWRSLWHTSGAVNLDSRSYHHHAGDTTETEFVSESDARKLRRRFLRGAEAALAAHVLRVRRLAVRAESPAIMELLNRRRFRALFSGEAARHVEELHAEVIKASNNSSRKLFKLSFRKLPSENLRELHVTGFTHLTTPLPGDTFPRLTYLHLKDCTVTFRRLQRIVDASPQLATLHLESSFFPRVENVTKEGKKKRSFSNYGFNHKNPKVGEDSACYRLVCPTITAFIFEKYDGTMRHLKGGLEIEAPRLRYFRYHGVLLVKDQLLLKVLGSSNVIQADLHIMQMEKGFYVYFWQFIHGFINAKV